MSFTRSVLPATSVFHSSTPWTPSSAEKYKALLNTVKPLGEELASVVGLMSFTRTVPVPVPSVFHNSTPWTPASAAKYRALVKAVRPDGEELKGTWMPAVNPEPGAMSFTCTVPPTVPSVLHSSRPLPPSSAEKYKALLSTVKPLGEELALGFGLMLMSFTCTVPRSVPSLFHNSTPLTPSSAEKNQVPLRKANSVGRGVPLAPGKECRVAVVLMSFTRAVRASVPSLFHSSMPLTPSSAANNIELRAGGAALDWAPPPEQPDKPNADASARALAALHNGLISFSSR